MSRDSQLIRPRALRPGDIVGVITPSTSVCDPDRLALVERTLRHFHLRMKVGAQVGQRVGDFQSWVQGRVDDLHAMFSDPAVDAVFCIRGGFGSAHLLDSLDYDLIRANPKILLGFSDITALHLAIHRQAGLVTLHGPVVLARFSEFTRRHVRQALFESTALGELRNPPEEDELRPEHPLRTISPGVAAGPLVGGNLALITSLLGTPHEIETTGKMLFLEEVGEEPYAIDRMLTQLRLAGKFERVAGVIVGECVNCGPRNASTSGLSYYSLGEVLDNHLQGLGVPVLYGLTIGHTADQLVLPLGLPATLDADAGTLTIEEPALLPPGAAD